MNKRALAVAVGAVACGYAAIVGAGAKDDDGADVVSIIPMQGGQAQAQGGFGATRNTGDTVQYIGCAVYTSTTGDIVVCYAHSLTGQDVACLSSASNHVAAARGLASASFLAFKVDTTTNTCLSVASMNASEFAPKK